MRKKISSLLVCPNSNKPGFKFYAKELLRGNESLKYIDDQEIKDSDDIKTGVAVSTESNIAYPINNFVGVFLSYADTDKSHFKQLMDSMVEKVPTFYNAAIHTTLNHIFGTTETSEGNWNRDEMKYYDAEVETAELREKMVASIKTVPQWRIFIPRKKHIIDKIAAPCKNQFVLEIGGGNSRTVNRMFNPAEFNFNYVGTDISFKRLLVAKQALPEGDFLQASALNLPFKKNSFKALISFGMLHHLPRPVDAVAHAEELIATNGILAFHEPVIRKELPLVSSKLMRKILRTYEHSEHDGKIDLPATMQLLNQRNHTIIHQYNQISIFRALAESLLKNISKKIILSKTVIRFLEFFDQIPLHTICLLSKRFGPNAVIVVSKKN